MKRPMYVAMALSALLIMGAGGGVYAQDKSIPLPADTQLFVRLTTGLSSKTNQEGDPWEGRVVEPIFAQGREAVPANSTVEGHVTYVQPPGRTSGKGEMRLVAETISVPDAGTYAIMASLQDAQSNQGTKVKDQEGTVEGPGKSTTGVAKEVGTAAGGGAAIGAMTHGGTGALYGAGIGVMAALIHSAAKKHKGAVLSPGDELTFVLTRTTLIKQPSNAPHPFVIHQDKP